MEPVERVYNAWVVVRPAADVADQWVAHVLDFDVVTQGNSVEHALQMSVEATSMVVVGDLLEDEDPTLRRAPAECWQQLWDMVHNGKPFVATQLPELLKRGDVHSLAMQMVMTFKVAPVSKRPATLPSRTWDAPLAYASRDGGGAPAHC